jgi:hypothetical protein
MRSFEVNFFLYFFFCFLFFCLFVLTLLKVIVRHHSVNLSSTVEKNLNNISSFAVYAILSVAFFNFAIAFTFFSKSIIVISLLRIIWILGFTTFSLQ